jgi:hypothetical protein
MKNFAGIFEKHPTALPHLHTLGFNENGISSEGVKATSGFCSIFTSYPTALPCFRTLYMKFKSSKFEDSVVKEFTNLFTIESAR